MLERASVAALQFMRFNVQVQSYLSDVADVKLVRNGVYPL
jgi:hypothetical protein